MKVLQSQLGPVYLVIMLVVDWQDLRMGSLVVASMLAGKSILKQIEIKGWSGFVMRGPFPAILNA